MRKLYSWNTSKTKTGYRVDVTEVTTRTTPDDKGRYCDTVLKNTAVLPTRQKAARLGRRWVRYHKAQLEQTA